ncbi:hypothetical protein CHH57_02255 [Niallia circulans]|uniref:Uncharacterized protein n=1 Tax=Niallia circulans TaxID=1397 RepID=A0AA91TVY7_NIACI|nr:hypothetical protein [Niallia circulans]PAD84874.1 hypothetical protein CHH57_02255 [Niallia circulans]
MNRDVAITYLKEINKGKEASDVITRLYYNNDGDYVQDLSYFTSKDYMSESLLSAIQNGQTLTYAQERELDQFIIESQI